MIFDTLEHRIAVLLAGREAARRAVDRWVSYQTGIALIDDIDASLEALGVGEERRTAERAIREALARGNDPSRYFTRGARRRLFAEADTAREMVRERQWPRPAPGPRHGHSGGARREHGGTCRH